MDSRPASTEPEPWPGWEVGCVLFSLGVFKIPLISLCPKGPHRESYKGTHVLVLRTRKRCLQPRARWRGDGRWRRGRCRSRCRGAPACCAGRVPRGRGSICGACVQACCPARAGACAPFPTQPPPLAAGRRRARRSGWGCRHSSHHVLTFGALASVAFWVWRGTRPQTGRSPAGRGRAHNDCSGGVRAEAEGPRRGAK